MTIVEGKTPSIRVAFSSNDLETPVIVEVIVPVVKDDLDTAHAQNFRPACGSLPGDAELIACVSGVGKLERLCCL